MQSQSRRWVGNFKWEDALSNGKFMQAEMSQSLLCSFPSPSSYSFKYLWPSFRAFMAFSCNFIQNSQGNKKFFRHFLIEIKIVYNNVAKQKRKMSFRRKFQLTKELTSLFVCLMGWLWRREALHRRSTLLLTFDRRSESLLYKLLMNSAPSFMLMMTCIYIKEKRRFHADNYFKWRFILLCQSF